MPKTVLFLCDSCGNEFGKWSGQCPLCHAWNSFKEVKLDQSLTPTAAKTTPLKLTPASSSVKHGPSPLPTLISELDRVLGPGLTPGGVYLLAGQPGIGKSTLLTQLALSLANQKRPVLYFCSEESPSQVNQRLSRLSTKKDKIEYINLATADSVDSLLNYPQKTRNSPSLIVVDSIQSVHTAQVSALPGSITQIRACASLLIHLAKATSTPLILVGHVTKEGDIAGPKLLEHMVDVVLQLEGDRQHDLRLLRGLKNRFGPTDETGIFRLDHQGLQPVSDPSLLFTDSERSAPGSALTMIMEGTRPLTVEVQALTVPTELPIPRRVAQGIPLPKLQLICAILTRHLHLKLNQTDVFLNVTGGLTLREPAADLAIALAILSSYRNTPLPRKSLAIGELGLLGEIRPVNYLEKRLKEAKTLGYSVPFSPKLHSLSQISLKSLDK